jgi:hypothetical protein
MKKIIKTIVIREIETCGEKANFSIIENKKLLGYFEHDKKRGSIVLLKDAANALLEKEKEDKKE